MKLFEKILVPTDFSDHAQEAVRYAAELSRAYDEPLTILHVYDVTPYVLPETVPLYDTVQINQLREEFQKLLIEVRQVALSAGVKQVDTELLQGSPFAEIVRFAEERSYGLIVMGTHGRTGLAHLLLGSVTEKVVRKAPCPVLTVPLREPKRSDP
jgi:nucleotide-binding universal stress UspA family protein